MARKGTSKSKFQLRLACPESPGRLKRGGPQWLKPQWVSQKSDKSDFQKMLGGGFFVRRRVRAHAQPKKRPPQGRWNSTSSPAGTNCSSHPCQQLKVSVPQVSGTPRAAGRWAPCYPGPRQRSVPCRPYCPRLRGLRGGTYSENFVGLLPNIPGMGTFGKS